MIICRGELSEGSKFDPTRNFVNLRMSFSLQKRAEVLTITETKFSKDKFCRTRTSQA